MHTKQTFVLVASILAQASKDCAIPSHTVKHIAEKFAAQFVTENPRFDRSRFIKACGIK